MRGIPPVQNQHMGFRRDCFFEGMDMERPCRRYFAACFCLLCLVAAGCMQFPYFLPEINYAPGVDAKCKRDQVHVFRVDVTQKTEIKEGVAAVSGKVVEYHELTRIRPSADGTTPAQLGVTFASGWRYVGVVNFTSSSTEHGVTLRFYRPGYETIAFRPGDGMRELEWQEAPELEAQIKAVDDLMRGVTLKKAQAITVRQVLEPGTKSAAQREALLFGAGEYERLARDLTDAEERDIRADLLKEARRLRALAEGK
jgi:hypothetical protein